MICRKSHIGQMMSEFDQLAPALSRLDSSFNLISEFRRQLSSFTCVSTTSQWSLIRL